MGIFDFLKKKKEEESIKFTKVESWVEEYPLKKGIDKKIRKFKEIIGFKREESKKLLTKLEEASLLNENIPERVKHIMDGNRKNYIKKTNLFLEEIKVPNNYLKIREFSKKLTEDMDELSKRTQKSYLVLKEFLETELAAVARKIKEIEDLAIRFRQDIEQENLHKLEEIKEKLSEYNNSRNILNALKELKERQEDELQELKKKESSGKKKLGLLKNASGYKEYQELKEQEENIAANIRNQKKNILEHFSTLEKAFKKYKRISLNESLIDIYLADSSKALLEDNHLEILTILEKMKQSLSNLSLKDKKEQKTREEIENLNKEALQTMRTNLQEFLEEEKANRKKLLSNTSVMNISEQETLLESITHRMKQKEQEIEDTEHKIERNNPRIIKQEIKKLLKGFEIRMENG